MIAPCTANTIAKLAHGQADNLLTITALVATCPLLMAPAMDGGMLSIPQRRKTWRRLAERGATMPGRQRDVSPRGFPARVGCLSAQELIGYVRLLLGRKGRLAGKKVVITAGGTQEPLDPVRVLTNRSSGKQGYALAQSAMEAGADSDVDQCANRVDRAGWHAPRPGGDRRADAGCGAGCMRAADALIMAAAVADFRPKHAAPEK